MNVASAETGDPARPAGLRTDMETWFVRRGVPQLIDDYATERRMDERARLFIYVWLVGGSFLWWGTRPGASIWLNLAGGVFVIVSMALGVAAIRKLRGQVMWWVDRRLDALATFSLGPLIALPSSLIEGSWATAISNGLNALLGMGLIYLAIGLGLGEIAWWSLKRLRRELVQITGLLARTLPVLLILVLFLIFAAELWEAAHLLSAAELVTVVVLLALLAVLLVVTSFRSELRTFQDSSADRLRLLAADTPAASLAESRALVSVPELRTLQRLNLSTLVVLGQLMQSAFVAVVVAIFLIAFGAIALPAELQERWIGGAVTSLATIDLLGEARVISRELVTTSFLLGSVVGLYFTGLAVTDSAYRSAHFDRIVDEARQLLAAHAFYRADLGRGPAES